VCAIGLIILKRVATIIYGMLEVSSSLGVIAFVSFSNQGSFPARLAAACTATYFLVRGLDNAFSEKSARQFRAFLNWYRERFS